MSEDDDYESLGDDVSLRVTMFAGAVAGVMEHCCMFPVDVIKTRQQALACDKTTLQSKSIIKNGLHIVKTEGFPRLFQVSVVVLSSRSRYLILTPRVFKRWLLGRARLTPSTLAATRR